MVSTVATDRWSDWSVAAPVRGAEQGEAAGEVTVEARREGDELGSSLWVYQVVGGGNRDGEEALVPLRECCWFFAEEEGGWEVEVGAYAARPAGEGGELEVRVGGFVVERRE